MQYTQVLTSIGILVISFVGGVLFTYLLSSRTLDEKKMEVEQLISFVINFVLFIWLGKILVNLPLLLSDPLVVLARPSDSEAFYVAVGLLLLNVIYHKVKRNINIPALIHSLILFFIAASFMNEFIKIIILGNSATWAYLSLLLIILIVIIMIYDKINEATFIHIISLLWLSGQFILGIVFSQIIIFTYLISPVFIGILFICLLGSIGFHRKLKV